MPERISIDLMLRCSVCDCSLKGEVDLRTEEIIVDPCPHSCKKYEEESD